MWKRLNDGVTEADRKIVKLTKKCKIKNQIKNGKHFKTTTAVLTHDILTHYATLISNPLHQIPAR